MPTRHEAGVRIALASSRATVAGRAEVSALRLVVAGHQQLGECSIW